MRRYDDQLRDPGVVLPIQSSRMDEFSHDLFASRPLFADLSSPSVVPTVIGTDIIIYSVDGHHNAKVVNNNRIRVGRITDLAS